MITAQEIKWLFLDYPQAEEMWKSGNHPIGPQPRAFANWYVRNHLRPLGIKVRTEEQPQRWLNLLREASLPDNPSFLSHGQPAVMAKYEPPKQYGNMEQETPAERPEDILRERPWLRDSYIRMGWEWQLREWNYDYMAYILANRDMKAGETPRGRRDGDVMVWRK